MTPLIAFLVVFVPMLIEARVSRAHERLLRGQGAAEPRDDVYRLMQAAYPGAFLLLVSEGLWRGVQPDALATAGAAIFIAAKALKYWTIATLGPRWTFRVLVPPGSTRILAGPYRWLRHPNYLAVAGELVGIAVAMHAAVSGPVAVVGFGLLMLARVRVEERALSLASYPHRRG